ncbi:MAG TPA: T9SS type A sorting domain-containing protein [Parafilimonas sp.]|nr:T9SS type A sorting domain-containing protein [Parafilimonas sp.]
MHKNSTHTFFTYLIKAALVCSIVVFCSFISTGINNNFRGRYIQAKTIKCYPNPAVSFVNFEFPASYVSKNNLLQVYSFTGKKMYETNITTAKATITFSNQYYRGIYLYQLQDKEGKVLETGKFQVNR